MATFVLTSQPKLDFDLGFGSGGVDVKTIDRHAGTAGALQHTSPYNSEGCSHGSFNIQQGAAGSSGHLLSLQNGPSTRYSTPNGFYHVGQSPNCLGPDAFNPSAWLNQSVLEQPSSRNQIGYRSSPDDVGVFANFTNDDPITGFEGPGSVNNVFNTYPAPFCGPYQDDLTADTNHQYIDGNPAYFAPSTQNAADNFVGWATGGEFTTTPALTTRHAIPEGRPMNVLPKMQPDATALHSQTRSTPLHPIPATLPKRSRRAAGKFSCPENGCDAKMGRRQDIERHVNQKHRNGTLHCPDDGCDKVFSRRDKRIDHLKKGHKLGRESINLLLEAKGEAERI